MDEHFKKINYEFIDNCFGEHISFYKLDIMEEKGYNVVWKSKLGRVNSPIPGDFHTIIWLIKGNI